MFLAASTSDNWRRTMKKIGFALIALTLMTPACAEQPGKKKDDRAAKKDDKKSGDKKADEKKN